MTIQGIEFQPIDDLNSIGPDAFKNVAAIITQYPNTEGLIYSGHTYKRLVDNAKKNGVTVKIK